MAYIYQIINDINNKIYIGKTEFSIKKRFKEHCRDSLKESCKNRPLYAAMRKYGIEHFHIELIEETDNPEEREIFWIEQKRSFKLGYNATSGGDGRKYLDYDVLIATYLEVHCVEKTAKICGCDSSHLKKILKTHNIEVLSSKEVVREQFGQCIKQYDLNNNFIQSFATARDAARFIRPNTSSIGGVTSHITDVCKGKRKTAYNYIWKYS